MVKTIEDKVKYIKIENHNVSLAYIDEYENPDAPVILAIHGLGNSFVVWMENFKTLKKKYRCIAIDLPGNGLSEKDHKTQYNIPYFSAVIDAFIKTLHLGHVHLMGHSMGGQISLYMGIHYPETIKSLILVGPAGFERFTQWEKNIMTQSNNMMDFMVSHYDKLSQALNMSFYSTNEFANSVKSTLIDMLKLQNPMQYKSMIDQCVSSMLNDTVIDDLNKIEHKTLIIFGANDAMIPNKLFHPISTEQFAKNAIKTLKNGELHIVNRAGHFVQIEASDKVSYYIDQFLCNSAC